MPRGKNNRQLHFKPSFKSFVPKEAVAEGKVVLLHEEIEAIYLMDVLELYQEKAAQSMQISRPTFARIIKSARKKLATALVSGYEIEVEDSTNSFVLAVISSEKEGYSNLLLLGGYIHIFQVNAEDVVLLKSIENPIKGVHNKPAAELPKVLLQEGVNVFISSQIGEGLKNSLVSKGIKPVVKESFSPQDALTLY